jgi:CDP-4-dehydro-6-deoxyglucose reductase/ferredoxin-NAD(P)+ reductase (naphthalene dioxygenase ferredoxin-specific)
MTIRRDHRDHRTGGPSTSHAGRVTELSQPAHHLTVARIETGTPFSFLAGQFVSVGFDSAAPRDLSIASRPGDPFLEFHIRDVPRHGASLFERIAPGASASIEGPFGAGYLREEHEGPILLVAGGSGIAPVKSIVETALRKGMGQPIHLYFGVRDEPDLYLGSHFEDLAHRHRNLSFVPVLSATQSSARRRGLVGEAVASDFATLAGFKAYVFGPPPMVEATARLLRDLGLGERDIHGDDVVQSEP